MPFHSWRNWGPEKGRVETRSWGLGPTSPEDLCMYVCGAGPFLQPGEGTFTILTPCSGPGAGVELCHSIRDTPPL